MIKLGITGGIGSGKSVVSELFKLNNIPIYNADTEAKKLNDTSPVVREKLIEKFGEAIYSDGKLDRKKFAQLIFSNLENVRIANSIIHPELAKDFLNWAETHQSSPIVVVDAAVLLEAKWQNIVDKVITVFAPLDLRVQRAAVRDNVNEQNILERAKHQIPEEEKIKLSHFVILNDNNHSLIAQVEELIRRLLAD